MLRALLLVLVACKHDHTWPLRPRAAVSEASFCPALWAGDDFAAEDALERKLRAIGGGSDHPTLEVLRAWLYRQPCVLALHPPCRGEPHPTVEVELARHRITIRLLRETATIRDADADCRPPFAPKGQRLSFDQVQ